MELHVLNTGYFKLDGGAMFGVVPKVLWSKRVAADENNLCNWALRCLLVEDGDRLILIDTGVGNKQSEKFFSYYYPNEIKSLEVLLHSKGFGMTDVTDVFLTHLHFDHCGGAVAGNESKGYAPAFPRATYWSNKNHWDWALNPNSREKASFLKENIVPIEESGQLMFLDPAHPGRELPFDVLFMDGHTEKQMLPVIEYKGKKLVFVADLLPSVAHLPIAWVMGFDVRPLLTLQEKEHFLKKAAEEEYILYFEHDSVNECCTVVANDGRVSLGETFKLSEI